MHSHFLFLLPPSPHFRCPLRADFFVCFCSGLCGYPKVEDADTAWKVLRRRNHTLRPGKAGGGECSNGVTRGRAPCPERGTGSPRARVCPLRPCDALFETTLVPFCGWREHFPFHSVFLCLGSCGTNASSHFPDLFPCQTLQVGRRVCSSLGTVEIGKLIQQFMWK